MKKIIIPAAVCVVAAVAVYAALLPSYGEKMRASILRAPANSVDTISREPDIRDGYTLVTEEGVFEYAVSLAPRTYNEYDYGGWADVKYVMVYSDDGENRLVREYKIAEYTDGGWSEAPPEHEGLADLKSGITDYISGISGDWGAYIKRLDTNEYLSVSEQQYSGASLIKLFTMAAVYNEIAAGSMSMTDEVRQSLNLMITESSNIECNRLTEMLGGGDTVAGFDVENRHTSSVGCVNTVHQSELVDGTGNTIFVGFNRTSPGDCARIMELVYRRKLVSEEASDEMLDMLKRQERTWKIPAGVPDGVVTANKTGETDTAEADAAIVYSPACDYVICVIGNGDVGSGVENIKTISRMTYEYFNP